MSTHLSFLDTESALQLAFDETHRFLVCMTKGAWLGNEQYDNSVNRTTQSFFSYLTESENESDFQDRARTLKVAVDRVGAFFIASTDSTCGEKRRAELIAFCKKANRNTVLDFAQQELARLRLLRVELANVLGTGVDAFNDESVIQVEGGLGVPLQETQANISRRSP